MSEQLDPTGNPVEIGGIVLRTPGLEGYAEVHLPGTPGMRAAEETTELFERTLAAEGLRAEESLELGGTNEVEVSSAGTRSTSHGEPAIEMDVQAPNPDWGQLVLSSDEAGVITWSFAEELAAGDLDPTRGGARRTYVVRRAVVPSDSAEPRTRGLIGSVGKKILKVIAFKILDPIGARVGEYFARKWEEKKRPYRFRTYTPDNYRDADAGAFGSSDWEKFGRGRALLMVHGTTSRAHTGFAGLPPEFVEELARRYKGRVFAFDHFTLSEDPRQNLDWFCSNLPPDQQLDVDIICHSRGGLVSRVLSEQQSQLSLGARKVRVGKIIFAAAPNAGTLLADSKYMNDFVDAYSNLLNFLPDTGVVEALEGIVTVAKQLAVGALRGLDGLQSMNPGGSFLSSLNGGPAGDTRYFALAANYEPVDAGFKRYVLDRLTDKIFRSDNDLVVPTEGVYRQNGGGYFPISEKMVFNASEGVAHSNFFAQPRVHQKILEWLN